MFFKTRPDNFNPALKISKCYVEHLGQILLLRRAPGKIEADKWGTPGGKIDRAESAREAMSRELLEETGIPASAESFKFLDTVFVRYPEFDFISHMFCLTVSIRPAVKINSREHVDYLWVKTQDALKLDLIKDEDACIKHCFDL